MMMALKTVSYTHLGMAAHIELVGLLGGVNTADGLINQALRGSQVGVAVGIDVLGLSLIHI